jgi:DUF218 domain
MHKPLLVVILSILIVIAVSAVWISSTNSQTFRKNLKQSIIKELVSIHPPAPGEKIDVIYMLGGNQKGLDYKAKIVADLYQKGICNRVWVLSLSGVTEYSQVLKRNWTKNEYSLMKLKEFGVPNENVELIKANDGFFGTLSEAEAVSSLLKKRGSKSLLLIAQPYHTQRVKLSFKKFIGDQNISLTIIGSDEQLCLWHHVLEFIKLKAYQYFLI